MPVTVIQRPASIHGCFQSLSMKSVENVIRSPTENGTIKVRRRTTAIIRQADATMVLKAETFNDFRDWYELLCMGGVHPTRFKFPPDMAEEVWRFSGPPQYEWVDAKAYRVSMQLEQLPEYKGL